MVDKEEAVSRESISLQKWISAKSNPSAGLLFPIPAALIQFGASEKLTRRKEFRAVRASDNQRWESIFDQAMCL